MCDAAPPPPHERYGLTTSHGEWKYDQEVGGYTPGGESTPGWTHNLILDGRGTSYSSPPELLDMVLTRCRLIQRSSAYREGGAGKYVSLEIDDEKVNYGRELGRSWFKQAPGENVILRQRGLLARE